MPASPARPMPASPAEPPRLVIFDLDGVVYRGSQAVPGAADLIAWLRQRRVMVRYATNNSMGSRGGYVERLAGHGIAALEEEIVTSTSATIAYLRHHRPEIRSILAAGSAGMIAEFREAGYQVTAAGGSVGRDYQGEPLAERYDAVVTGLDQAYDYLKVAAAATAISQGAAFIATNADLRYPTPSGLLPGAGSQVAAIGAAAGGVAPLVIGKPEPTIFREILEAAAVSAAAAVVVGDNPDSDVIAARRAGIFSVLVLTGVADRALVSRLDGERRPDAVAGDPHELARLFARWLS